jgi:hypothetical protein
MRMEHLDGAGLGKLLDGADVIEQDRMGPKVLALPDGRYLKLFRPRKRLFSRQLIWPAAHRFAANAARLAAAGIPTLAVDVLYRLPGPGRSTTAAAYRPLPGKTLRDQLVAGSAGASLLRQVGAFIADLHRRGIYFRSLHPGNVVVGEHALGLIDVLDLRFHRGSLSLRARQRNWRHVLRCPQDSEFLTSGTVETLLRGYLEASDLPEHSLTRLAAAVGADPLQLAEL